MSDGRLCSRRFTRRFASGTLRAVFGDACNAGLHALVPVSVLQYALIRASPLNCGKKKAAEFRNKPFQGVIELSALFSR